MDRGTVLPLLSTPVSSSLPTSTSASFHLELNRDVLPFSSTSRAHPFPQSRPPCRTRFQRVRPTPPTYDPSALLHPYTYLPLSLPVLNVPCTGALGPTTRPPRTRPRRLVHEPTPILLVSSDTGSHVDTTEVWFDVFVPLQLASLIVRVRPRRR